MQGHSGDQYFPFRTRCPSTPNGRGAVPREQCSSLVHTSASRTLPVAGRDCSAAGPASSGCGRQSIGDVRGRPHHRQSIGVLGLNASIRLRNSKTSLVRGRSPAPHLGDPAGLHREYSSPPSIREPSFEPFGDSAGHGRLFVGRSGQAWHCRLTGGSTPPAFARQTPLAPSWRAGAARHLLERVNGACSPRDPPVGARDRP